MDFKNQWDVGSGKDKEKQNEQSADKPDGESVVSVKSADTAPVVQEPVQRPTIESVLAARSASSNPAVDGSAKKARRFLIAYMTTVFSALAILYGSGVLGYVLFDHFFGPKRENTSWFYLDLAPLYISLMATLSVFAAVYIVASRYVAKSASNDSVGLKDWRAYRVVYAVFTALLIATATSLVAGLVYIPLAQAMIADDTQSKQILVQVLASVHAIVWIGLLIWQERLVKKAKRSRIQGTIVVVAVAVIVVLTGIFPVGSKTNDRFDHRVEQDLQTIESAISTYKSKNDKKLPSSLADVSIDADSPLKNRLKNYSYSVEQTQVKSTSSVFDDYDYESMIENDDYTENLGASETSSALSRSLAQARSKQSTKTVEYYKLCATFRTDTTSKVTPNGVPLSLATGLIDSVSSNGDSFTRHTAGMVCFTRGK